MKNNVVPGARKWPISIQMSQTPICHTIHPRKREKKKRFFDNDVIWFQLNMMNARETIDEAGKINAYFIGKFMLTSFSRFFYLFFSDQKVMLTIQETIHWNWRHVVEKSPIPSPQPERPFKRTDWNFCSVLFACLELFFLFTQMILFLNEPSDYYSCTVKIDKVIFCSDYTKRFLINKWKKYIHKMRINYRLLLLKMRQFEDQRRFLCSRNIVCGGKNA